ncbi:uncharacterized protein LOC144625721 [Crassostrea virginica]
MIRYWSYMSVVIATFLLGLISATEVKDPRRFLFGHHHDHPICADGEELICVPFFCNCYPKAIDGGWSAWSSKSCSTSCGDGVREETRTCTNPTPMHGGHFCTGESTRQSNCANGPCPTTAPQTISQCTSDLNCSSFTCPGHQHPFCEPYLEWSQCGCTECTRDEHCPCPQGMVGNCRDDIFERNCECKQLTGTFSHCTDDADCSTHKCTGNLRQSFCHKNKLLSFDLSNCDCRECSKDSHCQCQSGLIPLCESTTFGNTCQCKQPNTSVPNVSNTPSTTQTSESTSTETSTPPSTEHTTIAPSSTATEAITTRTTKTTTTTTTPTPKSTTITTPSTTTTTTKATTTHTSTTTATTAGSSSVLSSETTILPSSTSTAQSVTEHSTSALSNITSSPATPTVTTTEQPQKGKRKCHVCGDYDSQFSCDTRSIYLGNLQDCPVGADYCMTDIIHDGGTYPSTYKRCVTEVECANKWLHQTSDLDQCINYGNVIDDGQFSCHFCCTSDGCNSGQIPDKSTFYIKV